MVFDIFEELDWYKVEFIFKMYPGETYEDTDKKVTSSLSNFPYQIYDFRVLKKERAGDWGHLIKLTVELGIPSSVSIEETFEKLNHVTHLQNRTLID